MSNNTENNSTSADDDGRSPCVRAFVANFERRDSNAGIGNENRPPIMTKSKVALLRQTLGKTSDSAKTASSDSESGSKPHDDSDDASEHIVSVAKLKENLQKSASEKPIAPWAFGGAGRPVKEPKKPTPKHRSNPAVTDIETKSAKVDNPPNAGDRTKRRLNSSFKRSQQNLIESPVRTESLDESVFFGDADTTVSNDANNLQTKYSRSTSGDYQTSEKQHRPAPKVLPKPVPRKSKAKVVNVTHERSQSDDKCERTPYQNNNAPLESGSIVSTSEERGSNETLLGNSTTNSRGDTPKVLHQESGKEFSEERANHPHIVHQSENNTSMNVTAEDVHSNSPNKPHDIDTAHAETTEDHDVHCATNSDKPNSDGDAETHDEVLIRTKGSGGAVPPVAPRTHISSSIDDDISFDGGEYNLDNATIELKKSTGKGNDEEHIPPTSLSDHHISSESAEPNSRASSSVSSEHTTELVITDDESQTDDFKVHSITQDESILAPGENRMESPDLTHRTDSISPSQDSTLPHDDLPENGFAIESASSDSDKSDENSRFLLCMGPDFISDIQEMSSVTAEEEEYEALAGVVCCRMCEQDEEGVSWLLCPPETYRSTMNYVGSLFKDDILVEIGQRKFGTRSGDESSFMSSDLLKEALLDKATKKLECLKLQKQRLEAAAAKHIELEELVDAAVKESVDSRQYNKYRSTLEEFDQVTHLLLMLSSRLASTDNSLDQISFSDQEQQKVQLISKRDNLIEKFEEARSIKESSETRRKQLADHLQQRLKANEFFDYQQLLKTKCQLKITRHYLEDRVSLSEEQIKILVAIIERNTSARYC